MEDGSVPGGERIHLNLRIGNGYLGVIDGVIFPIIHPREEEVAIGQAEGFACQIWS